ncbi:MAG: DUF5106 domain-containing protein [Spirosomataceae bacterium]
MKRFYFLLLCLWSSIGLAQTQEKGYAIRVQVKGLQDSTCYLSHYFGFSQYLVKDTARADTSGVLLFKGKQALPEGLYFVSLPNKKRIELVVTDKEPRFSLSTDTTDLIEHMKVDSASKENMGLYSYLKYVQSQQRQVEILQAFNGENPNEGNVITQQRIRAIRNEMYSYLNRLASAYPDLLVGKYIKASTEPRLPRPPMYPNGGYDTAFVAKAVRRHFFDNIDFSDERLVRSPYLQRRLESFFERVVVPQTDSVKASCDRILALASANKEVMRYAVWYITNYFEASKVIGADAIFIYLAEEYYLKGKVETDSSVLRNLADRIKTLKPLLIGKPMPEMNFFDPNGKLQPLKNVQAEVTFVVFYDPLCKKCRAKLPALINFYKKHKNESIAVYAVMVEKYDGMWKQMLNEFKIKDLWINVWDKTGKTDFRKEFDVYSTPMIYVLTPDKKIGLKKVEVEQLEAILTMYKQGKQASAKATPKK